MSRMSLSGFTRWLTTSLVGCLVLTTLAASRSGSASSDALTVTVRTEPAFEHNLKQLMEVIQKAKRIQVVVYGPQRIMDIDKDLCARGRPTCKGITKLSDKDQAKQNAMESLCRGVLDALSKGIARPPEPIASLVLESDEEPYYQLVSGLARDYWKTLEPVLRNHVHETYRDNKEKADWALQEIKREVEEDFLDRKAYLVGPWPTVTDPNEWGPSGTLRPRRALYVNSTATDGRKRYLQLVYQVSLPNRAPLDLPVQYAYRIAAYDISPDGYLKRAGVYGGDLWDDDTFGELNALGVLGYENLALPWTLVRPSKLVVPIEFRNNKWRYAADINSTMGSGYTTRTCTYLIE